jgi:hypothetical protein
MFKTPNLPRIQYDTIVLKGGMDVVTPTLSVNPGVIRDASNFEVSVTGGYSRIQGYERADGQPSPSSAVVQQLTVDLFLTTPLVGDTVTGAMSGATGVVAFVGADYLAVTKVVGLFEEAEDITDGGPTVGTLTSVGGTQGSQVDAQIQAAAADIYRADIGEVPGAGPVRGVFYYNDTLFAFRNNVGDTAAELYMATTGGWVLVPFYLEVEFSAGAGEIDEGDNLVQGANTALIKRVVIESGDIAAGTAAGRFVIEAPAPGSFIAGAATISGGGAGTATLDGAESQITRPAGGVYQFVIDNFQGQAATKRVYGCDGVGLAFEFDGDVLVPVRTSSVPDTPKFVAVFKKQLFLAIDGSAVHSAPGLPYNFQGIDGAYEIAIGDTITGLTVTRGEQAGGAMAIYGRNSTSLLYGSGAADWQLVQYGEGSGCISYSAQYLNEPYVLDDRGVTTLQTSLNYGNFDQATLTHNIQPFINSKRTRVATSLVNRTKSQYRLLFNDGSGLFCTILNGKYLGAIPVEFAHTAFCSWAGETSGGSEVSYFGAVDSGYVFEMEKGTSFDGEPLVANFTLAYNFSRSPRILKKYLHAALEVTGSGYAQIDFGYSLGYGSSNIPQAGLAAYASAFAPANWDTFVWDAFFWDGVTLSPTEAELRGAAENIAIAISSGNTYVGAYTINSIIIHFAHRRGLR